LRDLGYIEGKNLFIEFRWAERAEQTLDLAMQLVDTNVDVIFAPASTQVEPARRVTKTIPIAFAQHADPVGLGDVASLSRPGGNITGLSMLLTELSVKELEIFRETLPHAARIGVLWNPTTPNRREGHPGGKQKTWRAANLDTSRNRFGDRGGILDDGTRTERWCSCLGIAALQRTGPISGRIAIEAPAT
jgi:hypothetical protein